MNIPECLYDVIGLSETRCDCLLEDVLDPPENFQDFDIDETTTELTIDWTPQVVARTIVQVNNTFLIPDVGYTISGDVITFVDPLEQGDKVYIRDY